MVDDAELAKFGDIGNFTHQTLHDEVTWTPQVKDIPGAGTYHGKKGVCDDFLGPVRAVQSLYREIDLLVIPSRSEGLPNVLLEALRADVPAVATRVGAVPEVLESDDAGLIVPPGDPAALADAIVRALPMKARPECAAARRETPERFSLGRRVDDHVELYTSLLSERRRGARRGGAP